MFKLLLIIDSFTKDLKASLISYFNMYCKLIYGYKVLRGCTLNLRDEFVRVSNMQFCMIVY